MAIQGLIPPAPAAATQLANFTTVLHTKFVSAGIGGMASTSRFAGSEGTNGNGTIVLRGVTGPVTKALLYWHGPTAGGPTVNAEVSVDGTPILNGKNIGTSNDNCWGFANSQAYRADVTDIVKTKGNGSYALTNFRKTNGDTLIADTNGASLIVFFDDPTAADLRDVTIFDGNDSDTHNDADSDGWSANLSGIRYAGGQATLQLHVSDGQDPFEGALLLGNGTGTTELAPAGAIFSGTALGTRNINPSALGSLWDVKPYDIPTSSMTPGVNNLSLSLSHDSDCISLIVALVSVPTPITLTPLTSTTPIFTNQTLTATTQPASTPRDVTFKITDGPNKDRTETHTTVEGQTTFTYQSKRPGTDTVSASFVVTSGDLTTTFTSNDARVVWTGVFGIAKCPTITGRTVNENLLRGGSVELFTGSVRLAGTPAGADDASYHFTGLAPNATYAVHYTSLDQTKTCGRSFTTDATGSATLLDQPPVAYLKNSTWIHPWELADGSPTTDTVPSGKSRWYVLRGVPAQSQVNVSVTPAEVDLTLVALRDIPAVARRLNGLTGSSIGVQRLTATSQDVGADDMAGDDMAGDDMAGDDMAGDDMAGDDMAGDDMAGDDMAGDDMAGPDGTVLNPDLTEFRAVYTTAQPPSVLAVSATPGRAAEFLTINARSGGDLYFRVRKSIKELSPAEGHYSITATSSAALGCNGVPTTVYHPTTPTSIPSGKTAIILTNTTSFGLTGTAKTNFLATLSNLASKPYVNGFVVDLADNLGVMEAYSDWTTPTNAGCVELANRVTDAIKELVNLYRASNPLLKYGVNAGGDKIVPLRRVLDRVQPPLKSEVQYSPPLKPGTAVDSSLAANYYLTADFYSASAPITRFGGEVWLPEFAWGILVETPDDITSYINTFVAANGLVQNPGKALSMGFDWNADTAQAIADDIKATGANVTSVINTTPAYTATDIRANLINLWSTAGYLGVQGHASASSLKAADNLTHLFSTDIAGIAAGQPKTTGIFVTLSCHSAFNIQNGDVDNALVQTLAWPEAFIAQGKTLLGGTGYQYAETVLIKNTERLLTLFTHELRFIRGIDAQGKALLTTYPNGEVPIGDAHVNAKRLYMSELTSFSAIDQKVLGVSAIFGLPMLRYDLPGSVGTQRLERSNPALISPTPGVSTGLSQFDKNQSFTLRQCDADGCGPGITGPSYFAESTDLTHAVAFRPIVARTGTSVDASGTVARGAVILDQRFTEESLGAEQPLTVLPVTEQPGTRPAYVSPVFNPWPVALNEYLNQQLVWMPTQYETDAGIYFVRKTSSSITRVYYSKLIDQRALVDAPVVRSMSISGLQNGNVHLVLDVLGHTNIGIEEVWATSLGGVSGASCLTASVGALNQCFIAQPMQKAGDPYPIQDTVAGDRFVQRYVLDVAPGDGNLLKWRGFFQIVGGNGLVRLLNNRGALFQVPAENATTATPKVATKLELTFPTSPAPPSPLSASFRSFIDLKVKLTTDTNAAIPGKPVAFRLGSVLRSATTNGDGEARVQLAVELTPRTTPYQLLIGFAEDQGSPGPPVQPGYLSSGLSRDIIVGPAATVFGNIAAPGPTIPYPGRAVIATLFLASPPGPAGVALNEQLALIDLGANGQVLTTTDGVGNLLLDTTDFGGFQGLTPGPYSGKISTFDNRLYLKAPRADITFTVVQQTFNTNRAVQGQGNFTTTANSTGLTPGSPATFELNISLAAGATTPTGNLGFHVKSQNFDFTGVTYTSMSIVGTHAEVAGFGTQKTGAGTTPNVPFRMIVDDLSSGDRYEIRIGGTLTSPNYAAASVVKNSAVTIK